MDYVLKKFFESLNISKIQDGVFKLQKGQLDNKLDIELSFAINTENLEFNNLFDILQFAKENLSGVRSLNIKITDLEFKVMSYFIKNFNGFFEYINSVDSRRNVVVHNPKVSYDDYGSEFVYKSYILSIFSNKGDYVVVNHSSSLENFKNELKKIYNILSYMPRSKNLFYPEINITENKIEFKSSYIFSNKKVLIEDDLILAIQNDKLSRITIYDINSIKKFVNYRDLMPEYLVEIKYVIRDNLSLLFKINADTVEISSDYFSYLIYEHNKLKISNIKNEIENNNVYSFVMSDSLLSIKVVLKIINGFLSIKNSAFSGSKLYSIFFSVKNAFENYFNNFDEIEELFIKNI
jgi:hypothetical protein